VTSLFSDGGGAKCVFFSNQLFRPSAGLFLHCMLSVSSWLTQSSLLPFAMCLLYILPLYNAPFVLRRTCFVLCDGGAVQHYWWLSVSLFNFPKVSCVVIAKIHLATSLLWLCVIDLCRGMLQSRRRVRGISVKLHLYKTRNDDERTNGQTPGIEFGVF